MFNEYVITVNLPLLMLMYRGIRHYCAVYYMCTERTIERDIDLCPESDHQYDSVIMFLASALHSCFHGCDSGRTAMKGSVGTHLSEGH